MEEYMNDEFAGVPYEIVSIICSHLDTTALINLQYTCRSLRQVVGEYLWHTVDVNGFSGRVSYNLGGASPAVVTSMERFYEGVKDGTLAVLCTYVRKVVFKVPGLRGLAESARREALTAEYMADIIPQYLSQLNCLSVVSHLVYDSAVEPVTRSMNTETYNDESNWAAHISNMFVQIPSVAKHLRLEMGQKPPSRPLAMGNLQSLVLLSRFPEHIVSFLQLGLPSTLEQLELHVDSPGYLSAEWLRSVTSECDRLARLDLSRCIVHNPSINYVPRSVVDFAPPTHFTSHSNDSNDSNGATDKMVLPHVTALDLLASNSYDRIEYPSLCTIRVHKGPEAAPATKELLSNYHGVANLYIELCTLETAVEIMESALGTGLRRLALAGVSHDTQGTEQLLTRLESAIGHLQELYFCPLFEVDYARINAVLLGVKRAYLANCLQCREEDGWQVVPGNWFSSPYYSFYTSVYFKR